MISRLFAIPLLATAAIAGVWLSFAAQPAASAEPAVAPRQVSVEVARERAKLTHEIFASTLEVLHDHYFHEERDIVPARALEDVFAELAEKSHVKARWISVNTKPMSIGHQPTTDFEKKAAAELTAGKTEYEAVEKGRYYRAGVIPLTSGCVACHTGFFTAPPKTPRFAGLVISIPVTDE